MDIAKFKKELKELLDKHDAGICFTVSDCSDTYGLFEERISVYPINSPDNEKTTLAEGWSVDEYDL